MMKMMMVGLAGAFALSMSAATMAQTSSNGVGNNGATRSLDRAAGTDTSGAYPAQKDGTPGNPPGTAAGRALDRAAGTDNSGAYPSQADGTKNNPRGTMASRAAHHVRRRVHQATQN